MRRTVLIVIGLVLVIAAAVAFARGGLPYRDSDTLVHIGDVKVSASSNKKFSVPPLVSGLVLVAGVGFIVAGARTGR